MEFSQLIGFAGTALVVFAYVPQVVHLIREHCSQGLSERAFLIWSVASLLLLIHALLLMDPVFVVLQAINLAANVLILLYARRYRQGVCIYHQQLAQAASQSAA